MMRYTCSSGQWILVYLVVSLTLKFFNCQHTCEEIDFLNKEEVVFQDDSRAYSQYYHYSQIVRVNQRSPTVDCKFQKFNTDELITPKFTFQVYGSDVTTFGIKKYSIKFKNGSKELGLIASFSPHFPLPEYEILNEKNLLAVRSSFQISGDSLKRTFMVTHLILPNGKIFVYYDNVPGEYEEHRLQSHLYSSLACEGDCPKHNTTKTCEDFKTPNTKCMWYEDASICIVSTDKDIDDFKVNSCQIENSSNVNVSTTSILVEGAGATSRISESDLRNELERTDQQSEFHLNMTTETTGDNGHGKSHNSLHIVIPVVICFLVVCSGCVIGLWLYRKNKCMQWLS